MFLLLDAFYLLTLLLLSPWLLWRGYRTGRYRRGAAAKLFGHARRSKPKEPARLSGFMESASVRYICFARSSPRAGAAIRTGDASSRRVRTQG